MTVVVLPSVLDSVMLYVASYVQKNYVESLLTCVEETRRPSTLTAPQPRDLGSTVLIIRLDLFKMRQFNILVSSYLRCT